MYSNCSTFCYIKLTTYATMNDECSLCWYRSLPDTLDTTYIKNWLLSWLPGLTDAVATRQHADHVDEGKHYVAYYCYRLIIFILRSRLRNECIIMTSER